MCQRRGVAEVACTDDTWASSSKASGGSKARSNSQGLLMGEGIGMPSGSIVWVAAAAEQLCDANNVAWVGPSDVASLQWSSAES